MIATDEFEPRVTGALAALEQARTIAGLAWAEREAVRLMRELRLNGLGAEAARLLVSMEAARRRFGPAGDLPPAA